MGFPLYVTCCFSLAAFNILSLCYYSFFVLIFFCYSTIGSFQSIFNFSNCVLHLCLLFLYFVCVLGDVLTVLIVSCIFSVLFSSLWSIFTTIILNSLSSRLFISSSFIWSCEFLPYSFICAVFICLFIFSKLAPIELSFSQTLGLHSFFLLLLPLEGKVS